MPDRHLVTVSSNHSMRYKISAPAQGTAIQPLGVFEEWSISSSNNPDSICATVALAGFAPVPGSSHDFEPVAASAAGWLLCSPGDSQGVDNSIDDGGYGNQD